MRTNLSQISILTLAYGLLFTIGSYSQTTIDFENFNSGFGIWIDGGSNCDLRTDNRPNNTQSVRLRDDNNGASMQTGNLNLSTYGSVTFSFEYETNSMETGESFEIQYSSNGGSTWSSLVSYVSGTDFNNGTDYFPTLTLSNYVYTFTSNSRFRIINTNASDTNDRVYIDNVTITGYPPAPEIDITGLGISIIGDGTNTPTLTDNTNFGTAQIISETITKTFVINNTGSLDLTLGSISLSGTTDFSLDSFPSSGTVISPGNSENIVISFSSSSIGTQTDVLTINSDDSDEASYQINLTALADKVFYDSDGDGIYDDIDIDDDNDGISDSDEENACRLSNGASQADYKFLNETFGTGTGRGTGISSLYTVSTTYTFEDGSSGGSVGDGKYTVASHITSGVSGEPVGTYDAISSWAWYAWAPIEDHTPGDTDGRMAVFNADVDPGIFYETEIKGTLANVPVTYSFWVVNLDEPDQNFIDQEKGGNASAYTHRNLPNVTVKFLTLDKSTVIASFDTGDITRCGDTFVPSDHTGTYPHAADATYNTCSESIWQQFTQQFTTSETAFIVQFVNNAPGGAGNDLAIDDIEVRQTLCDMDGDGVADVFDLDSDNDGIPDVVEAGLGNYSEGKATLTGVSSWVDANGNGMLDSFESHVAVDSDSDGIPDYLDLDSDNDGLFDVDEYGVVSTLAPAGTQNGDGDVTGDGVGDGPESETFREKDSDGDGSIEGYGDGILDCYDFHNGNTNYADSFGNDSQGTGPLYARDTDGDGIPDYIDVYNDITGIYDIDTKEIYASIPHTNGVLDDTTDADGDGIMASRDGDDSVYGSPRNLNASYSLFFDGRNDYVEDGNLISSGEATLMAFIKSGGSNTVGNDRKVAGQNDLYIIIDNATNIVSAVVEGNVISSSTPITDGIWTHVAVTTKSGETILYINGVQEASDTSGGISDSSNFLIGKGSSGNYYKGEIDEVRIFDKALTSDELKRMVYQELDDTNGFNSGKIIPTNISASIGSNLVKYYKMDGYKDDILDDKTTGTIDVTGAKIYNVKDIYFQRAPLPYETVSDGDWTNSSSWLYGNEWDIMSKQNNPDDASIVHIKNNINLDGSYDTQGMVGLIVDSGKEFSIEPNKGLYNSWYLKLNGLIDLDDESQLIQTSNSILDVSSAGKIERDQQGTKDLYTYNYWSSPVGISNTTTNNNSYKLPNVLKDGSVPANPLPINFLTSGYDGSPGTPGVTPISIADYWIWKYANKTSDSYPLWQHVRSTGTILAGEGFTMKGVQNTGGTISLEQNYVFNGKPNNGDISLTLSPGNDYLIGNPYASALDADEFILDNISSSGGRAASDIFDGALYFWEHFASSTHILKEYQGGYGTYTLLGGVKAISNDQRINATGTSGTKIPQRYIPVSQGFFVTANTGGNITFKNSQRAFKTETSDPSLFIKPGGNIKGSQTNTKQTDTREKIRLLFNSPKGYHRQLLTGVDGHATNAVDIGYDAPLIEDNVEDMYWTVSDKKLIIQAVNNFNDEQSLPLGMKINKKGLATIKIDSLENIPDNLSIYIKDKELNLIHDLKESDYQVNLNPGEITDRFEIVFSSKQDTTLNTDEKAKDLLNVFYSNEESSLILQNPNLKQIQSAELLNILGQSIIKFKTIEQVSYQKLKTKHLVTGTYIIELKTIDGSITKKVIIQ